MPTGRLALVSIAFAVGMLTFGAVTALVPEASWKGFHVMFLLLAVRVTQGFFGAGFATSHRVFVYGLAALFHALLLAVLVFFVLLFVPGPGRRTAGLCLTVLVIIDVVLLVLVSPMRELP
jgi:hypothetical protein